MEMKNNKNELRTFMNKQDFFEIIREKYPDFNETEQQLIGYLKTDYEQLIELRNRIMEGTDEDTKLYEDDHITLDHILDYMEILMTLIGMGEVK